MAYNMWGSLGGSARKARSERRDIHMRTERKRLAIFILIFTALLGAVVLLTAPKLSAAAAAEEGYGVDAAGIAPRAVAVARVERADGSYAEYATFSAAAAAWEEGSTLELQQDASTETLMVAVSCTLDLNGYTLEGTSEGRTIRVTAGTLTVNDTTSQRGGEIAGGGVRVERGASLVLMGGYITDNSAEDGAGVYVSDGGSFLMTGGDIMGNTAKGNGGGVYLSGGASFTMQGGRIINNSAAEIGGGVYAGGEVTLSGGARITGNTVGGAAENLYLAADKLITVSSLSGQVGITLPERGEFATGTVAGTGFTSDSPAYNVSSSGGIYSLVLSPLKSVAAQYVPTENVYPTTSLEALRSGLTVIGTNENDAQYLPSALRYELSLPEGVDALTVGSNEIVLTATGAGGEQAETMFSAEVIAPSLISIAAEYDQKAKVYFDSSFDVLAADLTVTGTFNDGISRPLGRTAEETQALSGEEYITSVYAITGDLAAHADGVVNVSVQAGGSSASIVVNISRHVVDTAEIPVENVTEVEGQGALELPADAFTPDLPAGVEPAFEIVGADALTGLPAGEYEVEISFRVTDEKNYELVGGTRTATLIVNHAFLTQTGEDGSLSYTVEREGGIPLSWELAIEDVTESVSALKLEDGMESRQIISISLRDGGRIVTELDTPITVRIRIDDFFEGKDVALYRIADDGSHIAVECTRDGDHLVFTTSSVQAQYAVAYNAGFGVYLTLTIVFGVLCVAGAVLLIWYFKHKKKLDMTMPKNEG